MRGILLVLLSLLVLGAGWLGARFWDQRPAYPAGASTPKASTWLVWYASDGRLLRLEIDPAAYAKLKAALTKTLVRDGERLAGIADSYLTTEADPLLAALPRRLDAFLDQSFGVGGNRDLLRVALQEAGTPGASLDSIQARLAEHLEQALRRDLLTAGPTLKPLRSAATRIYLLLRQDLIDDCDLYDRAFREFVLASSGGVAILDQDGQWHPQPGWQWSSVNFMSLCTGLRRAEGGHLADTFVQDAEALAPFLRPRIGPHLRPLAEAAVRVSQRAGTVQASLGGWGLSPDWSQSLAAGAGYLSASAPLLGELYQRLGDSEARRAFATLAQDALERFRRQVRRDLGLAYRDFIDGELERIKVNLAARDEGAWSWR